MSLFTWAFVTALVCVGTSGYDYFVDEHYNCTNVKDAINPPTPYVTLLGSFNSTQECINECINKKCDSYTYFPESVNSSNANECWSYINNRIWLPYAHNQQSDCGRIIYPCNTDFDCSLNGKCNTQSGNCTCRPGWNGYYCHFLSLEPANKNAGFLSPFNAYNSTSWGGSVQFDYVSNKYIMFAAFMCDHCGISSWKRNSEIVFAQTDSNDWNTPFTVLKTANNPLISPFAHSPDIIYAPDTDQYVLLHVRNASGNERGPCICTDGSTQTVDCSNNTKKNNVSEITAFITINASDLSKSYDINVWSDPVYIENIGLGDSNFAAVINNDSSLVGMIRFYLVTASDWKDNSTYIVHNESIIFPYVYDVDGGTEDFYVYKDCNGYYHCLFHNRDADSKRFCGAHAYSMDGINWDYGGLAFGNDVDWSDGTSHIFNRRERPHLIFDTNDRCTPVALTNSAEFTEGEDKAYTLIQPIKH